MTPNPTTDDGRKERFDAVGRMQTIYHSFQGRRGPRRWWPPAPPGAFTSLVIFIIIYYYYYYSSSSGWK